MSAFWDDEGKLDMAEVDAAARANIQKLPLTGIEEAVGRAMDALMAMDHPTDEEDVCAVLVEVSGAGSIRSFAYNPDDGGGGGFIEVLGHDGECLSHLEFDGSPYLLDGVEKARGMMESALKMAACRSERARIDDPAPAHSPSAGPRKRI